MVDMSDVVAMKAEAVRWEEARGVLLSAAEGLLELGSDRESQLALLKAADVLRSLISEAEEAE